MFLKATNSGWYPEFLKPVMEIVTGNTEQKKILDIGTGPGTLPQLLIKKDEKLQITGIDINRAMIHEARKRVSHKNITYLHQKINTSLEFSDNQFDVVTFCSVLFLLDDSVKTFLLHEALRVLKSNGKIIILTPSGRKPIISAFIEVWKYPFSFSNWTFIVWKTLTTKRAKLWQKQKWIEHYALKNNLGYTSSLTFNNNASLEIITKY
ncbi:MAG: class I SAM-dependent methyltransferase [Bacteroidota bacterium]|nr:class I SAM-dependent methyltransferase [Bacteroidota bacterium]